MTDKKLLAIWWPSEWIKHLDEENSHHIPWSVTSYKLVGQEHRVFVYQVAKETLENWMLYGTEEQKEKTIRDHAEWLRLVRPAMVGYVEGEPKHHEVHICTGHYCCFDSEFGWRIICAVPRERLAEDLRTMSRLKRRGPTDLRVVF